MIILALKLEPKASNSVTLSLDSVLQFYLIKK